MTDGGLLNRFRLNPKAPNPASTSTSVMGCPYFCSRMRIASVSPTPDNSRFVPSRAVRGEGLLSSITLCCK
jgi:hypothetical protein